MGVTMASKLATRDWVTTADMADLLGVCTKTLHRLKKRGFFRDGHHYRWVNPLSTRSDLRWHRHRVALRMGMT